MIAVKLGNQVTFQLDGGTEYFSPGDSFAAGFTPLTDEGEGKKE